MALLDLSVSGFLDALAADTPVPGGGSASALAGAMGAALAGMVGRLTVGKKKFLALPEADRTAFLDAAAACEPLRARLAVLVDRDAEAFDAVMSAYRLPKESPAELAVRNAAVLAAMRGAIAVPLATAEVCAAAIDRLDVLHRFANRSCLSDLGSAAALLSAALSGAAMNVEINLASLTDPDEIATVRTTLDGYLARQASALAVIAKIRRP